ncbi:bifunctional adenosylcobinamide kinase/adenosylcobinamide-phosphate guanylyltransferase [uncultured Paludibaculum sp.]|uniref:bifunctional adenosylcobinamide kinase/adenosylcobinamide-phosphate guanylyltransferase n=1 Tax=uncultured Paludibaculum sp. TaxID=1765020 RepID=UPI00374CAC3D
MCSPPLRVVYVATARPEDEEMLARIERHRGDRPGGWKTIEEPRALAAAIRRASPDADVILIDCLTVWLSNLCWELRDRAATEIECAAMAEIDEIATAAEKCRVILVSNDVGSGIVPDNPVGRSFRDFQGLVNQRAAAAAQHVFLTVAGIPLRIKPNQPEALAP